MWQTDHLIFRVQATPLGQKVLSQPSSFSLLVAASVSPSLPPGPQSALTHLLEASLHHLAPSDIASVTLPPGFDSGSSGVVGILLSRLADCLVPGGERFRDENRTTNERKCKKGPDANLDLEDDPMERGLANMEETFTEGEDEGENSRAITESTSQSLNSTNVVVDSEVAGGAGIVENGQSESSRASQTNDTSLRIVDNVGMDRRLALFLHKREDESPHEVCSLSLNSFYV